MKETHTQYKSGILIGLLSLSTLSSCVNTRRELGMDNISGRSQGQGSNENVERGADVEERCTTPLQDVLKGVTKEVVKGVAWSVTGAFVSSLVGRYNAGSSNCPNESSNSNNDSVPGTFGDMGDPFVYKRK